MLAVNAGNMQAMQLLLEFHAQAGEMRDAGRCGQMPLPFAEMNMCLIEFITSGNICFVPGDLSKRKAQMPET